MLVQYFAKDDIPNKVNSLQSNILNMTKISNVKVHQKAPGHVSRMDKALEVTKVPSALCDSGCTGTFIKPKYAKAAGLTIIGPSNKLIAVTDDATVQAQSKTLLPYDLPLHARAADTVPDFGHSLVGIKPFSDAGYISVFHPHDEGVTIHRLEYVRIEFLAPPIVQGPREESGLWSIPLITH